MTNAPLKRPKGYLRFCSVALLALFAQFNNCALAAGNPSTSSPLTRLHDVVIYSDPTFHCAFPSVVVRPDGELLCAFRRAPSRKYLYGAPHDTHTDPNSQLVLVHSRDNGETWTTSPEMIFAHPLGGSQDPCMIQLHDGTIVCTSYGWAQLPAKQTTGTADQPYAFLGGYVLRSRTGGKTWEGPFIPPDIGDNRPSSAKAKPTYNRGALAEGANGELRWAAVKDSSKAGVPLSVQLMTSADQGETWKPRGVIASDAKVGFNETSLVRTHKGDIVAFLRTEGLKGHAALARSMDGGRTFSPWQDLGFHGVPLQALRLRDDCILLVYGYRQNPAGIRAKLLNADASDAATAPEFIIRDDGGAWDLGYPWSVQLPDGKIFVAYYINIADGPRHIAGSFLEVPLTH